MKLVREHINEKFDEDSDPIDNMDIGINHFIKKWTTKVNLRGNLAGYSFKEYKIINGKINVNGRVDISWEDLIIPDYIKFGVVLGNFSCCFNGSYHFFPDKAETMRIYCHDPNNLATKEKIKEITKIYEKNIRIVNLNNES